MGAAASSLRSTNLDDGQSPRKQFYNKVRKKNSRVSSGPNEIARDKLTVIAETIYLSAFHLTHTLVTT
jgi:hypothetical protein